MSERAAARAPIGIGLTTGVASLAFYLAWQIAHLGSYLYSQSIYPIDDADEWRYTACSRLVEHGYTLFTQVFSAQPPLLFLSLSGGMRVFGDSITGARWTEIIFGVVGMLSAIGLGWLLGGPVAGAATGLLLAVSPAFLVYSHTVEAEGPMMALATLSLLLALWGVRRFNMALACAAGLALAGAVLIKLFALEILAPVAWLTLLSLPPWKTLLRWVGAFGAGLILPLALNFSLLHPRQQWDQVIRLHEQAAKLHLANVIPPFQLLKDFLSIDIGLSALAVAGLIVLFAAGRWRDGVFLGLWLVGTIFMLLEFRPLFPHHLAILTTALAVVAGVGIGLGWESIACRSWPSAMPAAMGIVFWIVFLPRLAHDDRHLLYTPPQSEASTLATYVDRRSGTRDLIVVDDLEVADRAHRLVAPPLCDPSNVRLQAGYLTANTLIEATKRYRPQVVLTSGIFLQVPSYMRWLRGHYRKTSAPLGVTAYVRFRSRAP